VFGDTGMRVGELVRLRTDDLVVRQRKNFLHVQGKGDLDRLVPIIDPALWRRLQRFVRGRREGVASNRLFLGLKRRAGHDDLLPLTESGVQQMVRLAAREAGIKKRVHPHLFRYSAATWMRTKGLDPLTIARVMGWTSLRMLQRIYDQASPTDDFDAMAGLLRAGDD
jgi:integrase/recombinase XerD